MAVLAGADDAVEERLLVAADDVVLDRVVVEEVVRGLDQGHALVVEVADQSVERVGHRHVVGVEHQHQVALGPRQRRVEVAGLGVGVVGPGHVLGAGQLRQLLHLRPAAVVEQVGGVGIAERAAPGQRRHDHLGRLVVGADVDVDRAPRRRRRPCRRRSRPGEPGEDSERVEAVDLGHQQHREQHRVRPFASSSRRARSGSRLPRPAPPAPARAAAGCGGRRTARPGSARQRPHGVIGRKGAVLYARAAKASGGERRPFSALRDLCRRSVATGAGREPVRHF